MASVPRSRCYLSFFSNQPNPPPPGGTKRKNLLRPGPGFFPFRGQATFFVSSESSRVCSGQYQGSPSDVYTSFCLSNPSSSSPPLFPQHTHTEDFQEMLFLPTQPGNPRRRTSPCRIRIRRHLAWPRSPTHGEGPRGVQIALRVDISQGLVRHEGRCLALGISSRCR